MGPAWLLAVIVCPAMVGGVYLSAMLSDRSRRRRAADEVLPEAREAADEPHAGQNRAA